MTSRRIRGLGSVPAALTIAIAVAALPYAAAQLIGDLSQSDRQATPATTATDTGSQPSTAPRLAPAATLPAACGPLRDRALVLLKDLRPGITDADRAALKAAMDDVRARGQREADGYAAFAGGAALSGQFIPATWAGLEALRLEWRPNFVANAGVYLYHLDLLDDAEAFLACAREHDPRSAYVIEAQAMLVLKRKDLKRAIELIELAVRLMPGDMNVRYNAAMIHRAADDNAKAMVHLRAADAIKPNDPTVMHAMEVLDPASAKRRKRDALDRLVEECFAYLDETDARAEIASEFYNRIFRGVRPNDWQQDDRMLTTLREHIADHRAKVNDALKRARAAPADPFQWNTVLYECADAYTEALVDYHHFYATVAPWVIMGTACGIEPVAYAERFGRGRGNDLAYVMLDDDTKYRAAVLPLSQQLARCLDAGHTPAADAACYRAFCADAVPVWRAYRDAVFATCAAAEGGYPGAAEDYGNHWLSEARRAGNFSSRAVALIKATPQLKEIAQQTADNIRGITKVRTDGVIEFVSLRLGETYAALQYGLAEAPKEVMSDADGPPQGKYSLCPQDGSDPTAMDEKLDPFLEALKAATTVDYGMALDCDIKVGGFSANLKAKSFSDVEFTASGMGMSARTSRSGVQVVGGTKVGGLSASGNVRSDGRFGGDVSYSKSASGGAQGFVGKATVKVYARAGSDGSRDYGAQLDGKIGAGINFKGVEAACYPFSGKVAFNARAFAAAL